MNLAQIVLVEKVISSACDYTATEDQVFTDILYASQSDSAGGRAGENAGKEENDREENDIDAPQASDNKREKQDNTGRAQNEDITNKANDQREDASITQPDTNLTGDTGNLDIGQTDLGASGTGAEDL